MPDALTVSHLVKRFAGRPVVDRVSFSVGSAEALALLGPSGCGKTTILRCIAGLETPDEGRIEVGGKVIFDAKSGANLPPERRGLGVVFQSYAVWPHMTVSENVGFPLRIRKIARAEIDRRVDRVLSLVGLAMLAGRPATELSGGQQQRVALGRALVHEPAVVLFDEALSNLDKLLREQMRLELKALQERLGFTAVYVTHDQDEALGLADSLVLLNEGRMEASGPCEDVYRCSESAFAARFFGWNVLPAEVIETNGTGATVRLGTNVLHLANAVGQAGDCIAVGFRREHVLARPMSAPSTAKTDAQMRARIQASSFQGLQNEYLLDIGDGLSVRAMQPAIEAGKDDEVEVVIAQQNIRTWVVESQKDGGN